MNGNHIEVAQQMVTETAKLWLAKYKPWNSSLIWSPYGRDFILFTTSELKIKIDGGESPTRKLICEQS